MLILLREGLEALLIIMALLSALTVAKQARGKSTYAGVGAGLVASIAGAIALQQLFPTLTLASNREMLEGFIGIVAVILMVGIGAYRDRSSVKTWNAFIKRHRGIDHR